MSTQPAHSPLQAGAAQVDICPPMGTQIAGDIGRLRPAEFTRDPLYARALVLRRGERTACILSTDLLAIASEHAAEIRRRVADALETEVGAILLHDTQTHAAPALGHFMLTEHTPYIPPEYSWLRGGDDRFVPLGIERIVQAARLAAECLQAVSVGAASGIEARVAFNRRFVMRDGCVSTHPATGSPLIRYAEGPIDPEVGIVCFTTPELRTVAMLLHHTCHPVHGYPEHWLSSGWPGAWCEGMRAACGGECVPMVLNGCCGNIHHNNHLDPTHVDDYHRMGALLTETALKATTRLVYEQDPILDWRTTHLRIPLRSVPAAELDAASRLLAQHPEPMWLDQEHTRLDWDWYFAVGLLDMEELRKRTPEIDYEIQVLRLGNIALVGLPGEPFVEGQLRIKIESPTYPTYVAHHCNQAEGYIPTAYALNSGGYETRTCLSSKLAPQALDSIADAAGALLRETFGT